MRNWVGVAMILRNCEKLSATVSWHRPRQPPIALASQILKHLKGDAMRGVIAFVCALILSTCLLLGTPATYAQGVGASGGLNGTVTDPTGAVVSKATVTADDPTRGIHIPVVTDDSGQYRFTSLAPGSYDLTVQASGFQSQVEKGVTVTVGEAATLDFHLQVATSAQTVEVNAVPPVVETERGSQADTITQTYIEDLPIDRRDYLTFTLLLPGVSHSTRLADEQA